MRNNLVGLQILSMVGFNSDSETFQVKFNGEEVGVILVDRKTSKKVFRSISMSVDGLHNIAEWCSDVLAKKVYSLPMKDFRNTFQIYLKTPNPTKDRNIKQLAEFIYKNKQIEDLPF